MGTVSLWQRFHQLCSKASRARCQRVADEQPQGQAPTAAQLVHELQQQRERSACRVQLLQCQWILVLQQWGWARLLSFSIWWDTVFWRPGVLHPLQLQCWNIFLQDQIVKAWLES